MKILLGASSRRTARSRGLDVLATQVLPAPSTNHNQPRRPSITPTSRKVAAGEAQRGFPRAGGWGVGAGKKALEGVPPHECSPPSRRRRAAGEVDRDRRALALGGCGDRGRVAAVEDRLWPYNVVSTFSIRSAAQSISSRPIISGGATRITVAWVSLHKRPSS